MSTIGTVQTFKRKPRPTKAIQFTGRNGRQITELIKAHVKVTEFNQKIRNYGRYMKLTTDDSETPLTVRVGDFIVFNEYGFVVRYEKEAFEYEYSIGKNHAVL